MRVYGFGAWWEMLDWRVAAQLIGIFLLTLVLFYPTSLQLMSLWNDTGRTTYTHGWLVLAVCIWWLADLTVHQPMVRSDVSAFGLLLYVFLALFWLFARNANIQIIQFVLLPALAGSLIWTLLGAQIVKRAIAPLLYFYFSFPIWDLGNWLLQWGTIFVVRGAVSLVGIPATFEDNLVHLQAGSFAIEGGCSGLHFVIVGLALAVFYGHLHQTQRRVRLVLLALSLAIFTNWIRVFVIVVAGYLTDMQHYLVTVDHYRFGWLLFALMMVVFFVLAARMRQRLGQPRSALRASTQDRPASLPRLLLALSVVVIIPAIAVTLGFQARNSPAIRFDLPALPTEWQVSAEASNRWTPKFVNADAVSMLQLHKSDLVVDVYRASYRFMRQDGKLAGYENTVTGELVDMRVLERSQTVNSFVETLLADREGRRSMILAGYFVGNHWFSKPILGQFWYAAMAFGMSPASGVLAMRVTCATDCDFERSELSNLLTTNRLAEYLPVRV